MVNHALLECQKLHLGLHKTMIIDIIPASGKKFPKEVHGVKNDDWGKIGQLICRKFEQPHKCIKFILEVRQENEISEIKLSEMEAFGTKIYIVYKKPLSSLSKFPNFYKKGYVLKEMCILVTRYV